MLTITPAASPGPALLPPISSAQFPHSWTRAQGTACPRHSTTRGVGTAPLQPARCWPAPSTCSPTALLGSVQGPARVAANLGGPGRSQLLGSAATPLGGPYSHHPPSSLACKCHLSPALGLSRQLGRFQHNLGSHWNGQARHKGEATSALLPFCWRLGLHRSNPDMAAAPQPCPGPSTPARQCGRCQGPPGYREGRSTLGCCCC